MNKNTEFKWTVDLLAEFIKDYSDRHGTAAELMEQFKESKQPKPEWEIIAYYHKPTNAIVTRVSKYWEAAVSGEDTDYEIHSVKRLSDNELFTIGEKVVYGKGGSSDIIRKIKLGDNQFGPGSPLAPYFSTENSTFGCYIHEINHYKEPALVFTTEDGIDIKIGDKYWYVTKDFILFSDECDSHTGGKFVANTKVGDIFFSTKEAANDYIIDNKPLISLKEIRTTGGAQDYNPYYKRLVDLAKSKLK